MTETPNDAAADPQQTIAELQRKLNELTAERDEATSQQTATADILKVISSSTYDLQRVLDALTDAAARLCKADMATITRRGEGGDFYHVTNYNFPADWVEYARKHPFKSGRGSVLGLSIIEKRAIQVADVLTDPEYTRGEQQKRAGFRTVLAVPLQPESQPIGVFILCRRTVSPFSDKQIELMSGFADQAVIAIENARLFNETKEALERQTATADILRVIASSPDNVQPVFEAIVESSNRLVDALSTAVYSLVDDMMHLMAFTPTSPAGDAALKARFPARLSERPWGEAVRKGEIFRTADTEDESVPRASRDLARMRGYRSNLYVPLLSERVPIGMISVTRVEPGPFAEHHVQLLKTFADQAVIAISNVRLFQEVQARTHDLEEALQFQTASADVLKVISQSPDASQPVFDVIVETSRELCKAHASTIFALRNGEFHVAAFAGVQTELLLHMKDHPIAFDQTGSALARAVREKRTVHIPNTIDDPEFVKGGPISIGGPRATLTVPLMRTVR